jgi:hypothetical protein
MRQLCVLLCCSITAASNAAAVALIPHADSHKVQTVPCTLHCSYTLLFVLLLMLLLLLFAHNPPTTPNTAVTTAAAASAARAAAVKVAQLETQQRNTTL